MRKLILIISVSGTFVMCKKGETAQNPFENTASNSDSIATVASEKISIINDEAAALFDSASIKIRDFEDSKNKAQQSIEATSKSIDSLSEKIAGIKLESKPEEKDSDEKKSEKVIINVPAPKIIKETKIVYKDRLENKEKISKNKMLKSGVLELSVNDAQTAKETVKEEVKKYDGYIRSENIALNNERRIAYLKVKVPIQKFDYLMDELSYNIGEVENKGIETTGNNFVSNTMCDLEITLYGTPENSLVKEKPETFGGKSLAAVSSGWNVIASVFLFILPLWPLFVIAGIVYYFYKKKKNKNREEQNQPQN